MSRHPPRDEQTENQAGGVYSRWSRRKQHAREQTREEAVEHDSTAAENADIAPAADDEPVKTDADMPPVDSIDEKTDVKDFFSPGVSETLRKAALNKLFHLPMYNIVDGLDDYDDDFRNFEALGDIITADMRHRAELEAERAEQEAREQEAREVAEASDQPPADDAPEDGPDVEDEPGVEETDPATQDATRRAEAESGVDQDNDPAPDSAPRKDAGVA